MIVLPTPGPIPFRHGLGNSVEMLRASLAILGVETDSTTLSGLSGAAFRTYWRAGEDPRSPSIWDPNTPQVCAIDPLAAAAEAFGWRLLWYRNAPGHVAFQFVMQSIGRGQPVLSYGFVGEPEETVIVGVGRRDESRDLLVQTRHASEPIFFELPEGPWPGGDARGICVGLFDRVPQRLRRPPEVDVRRALRRLVWLARTPRLLARGWHHSGLAAYSAWTEALIRPGPATGAREAADRLEICYGLPLPEEPQEREQIGIRHVLHRMLVGLAEARREGAAFLRGHGGLYDTGDAAACLDREADALTDAAALWPPVVSGSAFEFRLADAPEGFEALVRREETARCLRIAAGAHAGAVEAVERLVPPTDQELLEDESES